MFKILNNIFNQIFVFNQALNVYLFAHFFKKYITNNVINSNMQICVKTQSNILHIKFSFEY